MTTKPEALQDFDAGVEEILADLEGFRARTLEALRREKPGITEAQLNGMWEQAAAQFGLEVVTELKLPLPRNEDPKPA